MKRHTRAPGGAVRFYVEDRLTTMIAFSPAGTVQYQYAFDTMKTDTLRPGSAASLPTVIDRLVNEEVFRKYKQRDGVVLLCAGPAFSDITRYKIRTRLVGINE